MTYYGNCRLVIRGDNLNLAEIEKNLQIKPTRLVRRGKYYVMLLEKVSTIFGLSKKKLTKMEHLIKHWKVF